MDHFTRQQLKELADAAMDPSVSIFMPTVRSGREVRQNGIRYKNLLKGATEQLTRRGMEEEQIHKLLASALSLESNEDWWQHQSDGFAMFVAADRFEHFRLPLTFRERVVVGKHFYVQPLVALLQGDGRFYVLAVSQNRVRLLEGTHYSVSEIETDGLPENMRSALNIDEYVSTLQQHTTTGGDSAGGMLFHGQGGSDLDVKKRDELLQYFQRINASLADVLNDDRVPLVFAGVDYLFPIFQQACDHKGLMQTAVTGNPDRLEPEQLHDQAWKVVQGAFQQAREKAWSRYESLAESETATGEVDAIVHAATVGQVDTLLVAEGAERWGVIDEQTGKPVASGEANGSEDLINLAVVQTLANNGTVYTLPSDRFGSGHEAVAILRYPLPTSASHK